MTTVRELPQTLRVWPNEIKYSAWSILCHLPSLQVPEKESEWKFSTFLSFETQKQSKVSWQESTHLLQELGELTHSTIRYLSGTAAIRFWSGTLAMDIGWCTQSHYIRSNYKRLMGCSFRGHCLSKAGRNAHILREFLRPFHIEKNFRSCIARDMNIHETLPTSKLWVLWVFFHTQDCVNEISWVVLTSKFCWFEFLKLWKWWVMNIHKVVLASKFRISQLMGREYS